MSGSLDGRRALVTGGTRGIGRAVVELFVAEGAQVTATGTNPDGDVPAGADYMAIDFGDRAASERFAADVAGRGFDILVNNAGVNRIGNFDTIDPVDFDWIYAVNVRAPFLLARAVVGGMRERGWGRIVNVSSIFGVVSKEQRGSYSASKFALDGMTAALAAEVAEHGVLANCVAPGFVETDLTRSVLGDSGMRDLAQRVPVRRLAQPGEIARLVLWLAGPHNTYVSGQNVVIDGGFTRV